MTLKEYAAQSGEQIPQQAEPAINWLDVAGSQIEALQNAQTIALMKDTLTQGLATGRNPAYLLSDIVQILFGDNALWTRYIKDTLITWSEAKQDEL